MAAGIFLYEERTCGEKLESETFKRLPLTSLQIMRSSRGDLEELSKWGRNLNDYVRYFYLSDPQV